MKRVANLYDSVTNIDDIIEMTNKILSRTRNKKKVEIFEKHKMEHICNIKRRLDNRDFRFGRYNIFMITDPKARIVMAEELEDKIINNLIAEYILVKVFEKKHTDSMCATRVGKGTAYAIKLLRKYINDIKNEHDNFYVLKVDISKYFYRIDHDILKRILSEKIKDKAAINVLYRIIDTTNDNYVNENIQKLKDNRIKYFTIHNLKDKDKLIAEINKIPLYEYNKGVALGNQTSQAFGLIYLYKFNHYLREFLDLKYVINYMDDFVIFHHDKEYLKYCLDEITKKLKDEYKLDINTNKTKIHNIKNGVEFLGYRFCLKNGKVIAKVKNATKRKFKIRTKELKLLYDNCLITKKEFNKFIASYKGILMNGNCNDLYYKVMVSKNDRKVL